MGIKASPKEEGDTLSCRVSTYINPIDLEDYIKELGEHLILRRARPSDAEALAMFNARLHSDEGLDRPDMRVYAWTQDLLLKPHPTFKPSDFIVIVDQREGKIVSSLNLISQTWAYGDIPFRVGRIELVGTLPEYRHRGLVREQFEVVHEISEQRGQALQAITGIPYYYRQFGYEMGLSLGGGRLGYRAQLPKLAEGEPEPFVLRPAEKKDVDFIQRLYEAGSRRSRIRCLWDKSLWEYELLGKSPNNVTRMELRIIQTRRGKRVGFLAHPFFLWRSGMLTTLYELEVGISWGEVTPSVVRYLYRTGEEYAKKEGKEEQFCAFGFWLGTEHPAYQVMQQGLVYHRRPYAWYLRVPHLDEFLRRITPELEQNLAQSPYAGHSGMLKLTFYRDGLSLMLKKGKIVEVNRWKPEPHGYSGDAGFPELTFLQLLFGYRSLDELKYAFADCWWKDDQAYGLLNVLFPKRASEVWAVT